jgi:hypothetical protein
VTEGAHITERLAAHCSPSRSPEGTFDASCLDRILALGPHVRYAAVVRGSEIVTRQREELAGGSAPESDFYEELLVNPTILGMAGRRGDLDCGGLRFVVVSYGLFQQVVVPTEAGHLSVAVELDADAHAVAARVLELLADDARPSAPQSGSPAPPAGLPRYRLLTGPDDEGFCRRVSEALDAGYALSGSPFGTSDGERTIVGQALMWAG